MGCPFAGGSVGVACQRHGRGAAGPSGRARPRARVAGMPRGPARPRAAPERARPAAPGALGTMSGEGAILVPRAAAWRLRHAAARGLSPWRRATPGIAILVFARPPPNSWPRGNTWAAWGAPPLSSRAMSARACLSTSGRLHSEFMRLLYFLAECVGGLLQTDPQERAKTATADKQASDYFTTASERGRLARPARSLGSLARLARSARSLGFSRARSLARTGNILRRSERASERASRASASENPSERASERDM